MRDVRDKLGLALVVAVTAATLFTLMRREPAAEAQADAPQPQLSRGLQWLQATGPADAPSGTPAETPEPSLSDQVDRLIATRDPANAFAAYQLLANCDSFNRDGDRIIFDMPETGPSKGDAMPGMRAMTPAEKAHEARLCRGMTERMRQSRLDYLAVAAQAGVPGAAIAMATEGPFGDRTALATRPNDPLVQQWKTSVHAQLTRAGDAGDLGVLHYLAGMQTSGDAPFAKNAAEAYRYGLALGLIQRDVNGPNDVIGTLYSARGGLLQAIGAELSDEQRAAELAAATRILERDQARRRQAAQSTKP
jgi:hypothetical protein